jgi:hypothetical protein
MPTTSFNLGRDVQLVLIGSAGRVDLTYVTGFKSHQMTEKVRVRPLGSVPLGADVPVGWEGDITLERGDSGVDDFFSAIEQGFWSGADLANQTMYEYISEVDGSVSTYQYNGVSLTLSDAGDKSQNTSIKQTIEFFASTRQRL